MTAFDPGEYVPPLKIYLLALYCITCFSLQITLADVVMIRRVELLYIILTIISGYIWFSEPGMGIDSCTICVSAKMRLWPAMPPTASGIHVPVITGLSSSGS